MSAKKMVPVLFACILVILAFIFWPKSQKSSSDTIPNAQNISPPDKLRVQTGWLLNGEFAYICSAIVNGDYAKENLEVELIPGGPSGANFIVATNAIAQDDSLDIGIESDLVPILRGVTQTDPDKRLKVKAFAAHWNDVPYGFIVREDSGITSIKNFGQPLPDGSKVRIGATADFVLQSALAQFAGVPESELKFVTTGFDATPFLAKQVDALAAFWTTQAYEVEQAGIPYRFLPISEIPGLVQPSMIAVATDKTINAKAGQLIRWLRATNLGVDFVRNNPEIAAKHILDSRCGGPGFNENQEAWLIKKSLPLYENQLQGQLNLEQIQSYAAAFMELGQIPFIPELETFVNQDLSKQL